MALACVLEPGTASAYLDPSTGSMLISGLISLVATAWLVVQTYWSKLVRLFRRGDPGREVAESAEGDEKAQ
jgi:hypothetical protein